MRDRKLRVGPQDGMDDNQSIADSSSDFEIGDDDVCDIDSEWSDSAVASLGLKVKGSVRRRALLPDRDTDSGDEDNLPLSSLRKQNDYIQRVSVEAAQPLDATISSSQTATLLSENHQPMRSPVVVADVPDTVAPAPKEISASSSTPHPPASTVREDVGLSPRSSSAAPVEPGPSSVTSYISSECTDRGSKKMCGKRPCQPSTWKQNERKMLKNIGKAYIGFKGKEVLSKTIGPGCENIPQAGDTFFLHVKSKCVKTIGSCGCRGKPQLKANIAFNSLRFIKPSVYRSVNGPVVARHIPAQTDVSSTNDFCPVGGSHLSAPIP
ncbi:hypothetical protein RRG08_043502 [Elysia crispata]|uniref:Uncharacterized protein n=1 Tax=Elysia crispata TaxID=231223 RepID=A0AAE0YFV0_9GAST|nr:hypothetical protein RRG08_043502 [Elysia crispata]